MARRRNPFPALVAIALVPAVALGGCWRFADERAPNAVSVPVSTHAPTTDGSTPVQVPTSLATPLLSVRRSPAVLSRDVNMAAFRTSAEAFLAHIDGTSCISMSIDGQPVASKNADLSLRPASNMKLVTAAVALDVLGPGFTYTTEVRGAAQNGVVTGDLYLVGGGDPLLSSSWWKGPSTKYPPFNVTPIEALAEHVKAAGITHITGSVVGDASRYDDEWYAPTWGKDVRFTEGGPISALLANDSREAVDTSSNDPVVGAAKVFTEALQAAGITVDGAPKKGVTPTSTPVAASVVSQALPAVIQEMLTTSDNNTAEMMLKEIGLAASGKGTRVAGVAALTATLTKWGVPLDGVTLVDGSGLSDENRLTCNVLLTVLQRHSPLDPIGRALPVAAKAGGTLADAFNGTPLAGRLLGKTGTLYNYNDGTGGKPAAKSLSGYLPLDGGGAIEFSMLLNGPQIAEQVVYRPIWDAFAKVLESYPSGPTAARLAPR